jgi:hypothetical protein
MITIMEWCGCCTDRYTDRVEPPHTITAGQHAIHRPMCRRLPAKFTMLRR